MPWSGCADLPIRVCADLPIRTVPLVRLRRFTNTIKSAAQIYQYECADLPIFKQEYQSRLQAQGRTDGFSLALNPTSYMREEGMLRHPKAPELVPVAAAPSAVGVLERESGQITFDGLDLTPDDAVDTSLIEGDFEGVFFAEDNDQDYTDTYNPLIEEQNDSQCGCQELGPSNSGGSASPSGICQGG